MQVVILKENLSRALLITGRFISTKAQLPILSCVLFKANKSGLTLSATNLEMGVSIQVGAKVEKEGEIAIPGKLLSEFVSTLTTDKIECTLKDTTLVVKTGKTQATFTSMSSSDFPPFPEDGKAQQSFPIEKIKDAVMRTVFAASNDEARPILTGVKTKVEKGVMQLTSTDGFRLSMEDVAVGDTKQPLHAILPATSLTELVRIASELKVESVGVSTIEGKNQVVFTVGDARIFTRLIDGEFPNIEKIIPTTFKTKVVVEKEVLTRAVKTASLFARGAANIVKIKIETDGLRISANSPQVGEDQDFIEAKVDGEESEIAFNYRFLLDILNNFPGDEVVFESSGPLNPGVFKPASPAGGPSTPTPSFLHIIMPVRVQS